MPKTHSVSIIIPCRDDYKYLSSTLLDLSNLSPLPEIIVSDASKDHSIVKKICKHHQIKLVQVEPPSRGQQLDKGAEKANSDILLFHHADTDFSQNHYDSLIQSFNTDSTIIGGAFLKDINDLYPMFRLFSWFHKIYTMHIGTLYGDQSVFVLRSIFFELGGFEGLPLMEDVNFSSKLRDYGNVRVLAPKIKSSKRKFSREGTLLRKLKNMWLIILYRLGVSPYKLAEMYYGDQSASSRGGQFSLNSVGLEED